MLWKHNKMIMIKVNTMKRREILFKNKYYENKDTIKDSCNDQNCNDKNMVPNLGFTYTKMVKIGSCFCLSKLDSNHMV